ncbi:hypothetical protein CEP54_000501 [Fusarium duplospermum]|uniref:Uncharacterized protein n=1 Tax=Fusarium duplospermum TaxID=1325734 RepID=A0A428R708_9HYPO|nr:hypothetical protein CEP54_000501 [Fusarium duplospermum]
MAAGSGTSFLLACVLGLDSTLRLLSLRAASRPRPNSWVHDPFSPPELVDFGVWRRALEIPSQRGPSKTLSPEECQGDKLRPEQLRAPALPTTPLGGLGGRPCKGIHSSALIILFIFSFFFFFFPPPLLRLISSIPTPPCQC